MDKAILSHVKELKLVHLKDAYTKVDEIPFDFIRRRMSIVVIVVPPQECGNRNREPARLPATKS